MKSISIVIADDHWMVRDGIKQLLELNDEFKVIGQANEGRECLQLIQELNPDIVLLDINMQGYNGLDVLEELRQHSQISRVVILTIHNEAAYVNKAMKLGASGYVLKDSSSEDLKTAIVEVMNGKKYIDPQVIPYLYSDRNNLYSNAQEMTLTDRELEVLILLTQGLFNKEIGYKLGISEKTVKNHVSNIFKKIDVSDRTQAAIYAIKNNIVDIM